MIFRLRHLFQQIMRSDRAVTMPGVFDSAHVAGLFINVFCGLGVGRGFVLAPTTNIDPLLDAFNRYPFDIPLTVSTVLTRILAHAQFHHTNPSHLRFVCTGAAPMPTDTQQAFSKVLVPGTLCQMTWGMTELLATMHVPGVCGPRNSIGKPLAGNAIEIRDVQRSSLPKRGIGEIYVCGEPSCDNPRQGSLLIL